MIDVIIIGAGVNGCFLARELSRFKLNILVLEKNNDVGDGASGSNSAIIHSGYDPKYGTLKAKLNVFGSKMFENICDELDVEYKKIGSITIARNDEEISILKELKENAIKNGVDVQMLNKEEAFEIESFLNKNVKCALFAKDAAIINPFELCVALMENAMDNGVSLNLNEKVIDIKKNNNLYKVYTDKNEYTSKIIINAAGVYSDEMNNYVSSKLEKIVPRKGEYYVLDHFKEPFVTHTIFSVPSSKGKGVLITPTTHNNYLIGPSADFIENKDDVSTNISILNNVLNQAKEMVDSINMSKLIREFAGLRAYHESNDFVIEEKESNFYNILGVASPGLASSPAIANYVLELIKKNNDLFLKNNYIPFRRKLLRINNLTLEERQELIKKDPKVGHIVCRCEHVSEAEIVDAIRRNCGAKSVKGVKKRVRPGFGLCQGGFCEPLIVKILARELNISMEEVLYDKPSSNILTKETKGESNEKL